MKYAKLLGFGAFAAAMLMAWTGAGVASATTVECEGAACGANTVIKAVDEGSLVLDAGFGKVECGSSFVEGKLENLGGATATASGKLTFLNFGLCEGGAKVEVLKMGSLEVHTPYSEGKQIEFSNNNGTITSSGAEVTVEAFGFHCIYSTHETDLGKLTGSASTGAGATLHLEGKIPLSGGRGGGFCGGEAPFTGSYVVTSPKSLNIK